MADTKPKPQANWKGVKAQLASFDEKALLGLIQELYAANNENQAFLHTRFSLIEEALEPYRKTIHRYLWPDVFLKQDVSVAKARKAISDYKKATQDPAGLAELRVFYCECATGFCKDVGYDGDSFLNSLMQTFADACAAVRALPEGAKRQSLVDRLDEVVRLAGDFGWGVGDSVLYTWSEFFPDRSLE